MTTTNNSLNISLSGQTGTGTVVGSASPTLTGTVTLGDTTTPALVTASGKTNTGYVQVNGKTSGALKVTAADATAQTVTLTTAAQTVGAATLTIPDMANTNKTVAWLESPTLTTPNIGVASGTSLNFGASTTNGLIGVTGGTAAAAGVVGEIISSTSGSVNLPNVTPTDLTSITLTPGDWDVWGQAVILPANTTQMSQAGVSVSAVSGGFDSSTSNAVSYTIIAAPFTGIGTNSMTLQSGVASVSVSTNTTFYLSGYAVFSVSTASSPSGKIQARRRR